MKILLLIILMPFATVLGAQDVYRWVDEDGEVHYSETLPPEQSGKAHDRLTREGLLAERIERVKTREELAALKAEQEQATEAAERERLQAQRDRMFLAAFPTEDDVRQSIESRRESALAERNSVESLVEQNRRRFAARIEDAAALERQGKPVPDHLTRRIDEARQQIRELSKRLADIDQRLADLDEELTAELERHRRLTDSG